MAFLDMDNDGFINMTDLYNTLRCLTREELTKEEINLVVQKVLFVVISYKFVVIGFEVRGDRYNNNCH